MLIRRELGGSRLGYGSELSGFRLRSMTQLLVVRRGFRIQRNICILEPGYSMLKRRELGDSKLRQMKRGGCRLGPRQLSVVQIARHSSEALDWDGGNSAAPG